MKKSMLLLLFIIHASLIIKAQSIEQSTARLAKEEVILKDIFNSLDKDKELAKMLHEGLLLYKKRWQTPTNIPAIHTYEKALNNFANAILALKSGSGNLNQLIIAEKAIEEADKAVTAANPAKKKFDEEAMKKIHEAQSSLS